MPFRGETIELCLSEMSTISGAPLEKSKPGSVIKIPYRSGVERFNLVRKKVIQNHLKENLLEGNLSK